MVRKNSEEVVLPLQENKKIMVIDLKAKTQNYFLFPFNGIVEGFKFEESQYICFRQTRCLTTSIDFVKMSYFHANEMEAPFLEYEFSNTNYYYQKKKNEYIIPIFKGNNHSLLYYPKNKKNIEEKRSEVKLIDACTHNNIPEIRTRVFKTPVNIIGEESDNFSSYFWEIKSNEFAFSSVSES